LLSNKTCLYAETSLAKGWRTTLNIKLLSNILHEGNCSRYQSP
jgi:hypothetical protein